MRSLAENARAHAYAYAHAPIPPSSLFYLRTLRIKEQEEKPQAPIHAAREICFLLKFANLANLCLIKASEK